MSEHVLKTIPPYFESVYNGTKTFEVRKNDRGYQTGDVLVLWEYKPGAHDKFPCDSCIPAPRSVEVEVSYVFAGDPRWPALQPGYVVLGLRKIRTRNDIRPAPPADDDHAAGARAGLEEGL